MHSDIAIHATPQQITRAYNRTGRVSLIIELMKLLIFLLFACVCLNASFGWCQLSADSAMAFYKRQETGEYTRVIRWRAAEQHDPVVHLSTLRDEESDEGEKIVHEEIEEEKMRLRA
jgi:hypothetical protein